MTSDSDKGVRTPLLGDATRRTVLKGGAAAIAAAGVFRPAILRAATPVIKIGHVSPQTGPMAGFADSQAFVLDGIRKYLKDGLQIGGKTYQVDIITKDSQTDQSRTAEVASDLILKDKVNIITGSSGSIDTNPVANQAELNEVPCITTDNPWESYFYGRNGDPKTGFDYTYHFFWGLDDVLAAFTGLWKTQDTNKVVGILFNTAQDDVSWHNAFIPTIQKAGFKTVDPGMFPAFGNDFTPQITMFKKAGVEIVTGNLFTPDFATFWTQCAQQGFKPKIVTLGKAFLFPTDVAALGERALNVTCELWWSPSYPYVSSLTGMNGHQLVSAYEAQTGRHWTAPTPFKHALFEVVIDVLKRTEDVTDPESILKAINGTNLKTIVGPVKWPGPQLKNISPTPVVAGQWQKHGDRLDVAIVNNGAFPDIPVDSPLLPLA
ncbi:amino acid/amide ABC transporter substrate-binding protein, HAAT family [Faunimonas pinastri]|uniref:Amino acid/amide ABC transporter substrate-binding protein, HAAT family n=1 Tax=Faunimonas pinastri TaxID=1855383 RepID=A0A1H9E4I9_9HYPH|nr:ABC transporter substrate-binding protein [Faunimonas pinastri]SEQ20601.1 amino acid/amide ABC transporter substrate-binding protein, HAAT family [Faunimonas pinastri]